VKRSAVRVSGVWTSSSSSRPPATAVARGTQQSVLGGCGSRLPVEQEWVGVGRCHATNFFVLRDGRSWAGHGWGREFCGVTCTALWGLGLIGS